jgi:hypothetical protein
VFLLHFKFIDRLLPQLFPFSLLELLCVVDQKILLLTTTAIWREDEKRQLLRHVSQELPLQRFYWISVGRCENQGKHYKQNKLIY